MAIISDCPEFSEDRVLGKEVTGKGKFAVFLSVGRLNWDLDG